MRGRGSLWNREGTRGGSYQTEGEGGGGGGGWRRGRPFDEAKTAAVLILESLLIDSLCQDLP